MYEFAHQLLVRGHDAVIHPMGQVAELIPLLPGEQSFEIPTLEVGDDYIHLYPDIVADNYVHAQRVVHWNLGPQRYEYSSTDLVFGWPPNEGERLVVNVIEPQWFYPSDTASSRAGVVWWKGKGNANRAEIPDGAVEITLQNPRTRKELGDLLREVECLICFDPSSCMVLEAQLCGTPVHFPPSVSPKPVPFFADYQKALEESQNDVDQFIERCEAYFD